MKVLTDTWQVHNCGNADFGMEFGIANARDLEQLRAVQRTSCEDDLLLCRDGLAGGIVARGKLERLVSKNFIFDSQDVNSLPRQWPREYQPCLMSKLW